MAHRSVESDVRVDDVDSGRVGDALAALVQLLTT